MRAITFISALVFRANIPSSVLLPTPLPAKIPILCPLPTVIKPSTALTPSGNTSLIISLDIGSGGVHSTGYLAEPTNSSPVIGLPNPSRVFPNTSSLTATFNTLPVFSTMLPGPIPSTLSKGISNIRLSLNPTTSAITSICGLSFATILHKSLRLASGPMDSIVNPTILATLPIFLA